MQRYFISYDTKNESIYLFLPYTNSNCFETSKKVIANSIYKNAESPAIKHNHLNLTIN